MNHLEKNLSGKHDLQEKIKRTSLIYQEKTSLRRDILIAFKHIKYCYKLKNKESVLHFQGDQEKKIPSLNSSKEYSRLDLRTSPTDEDTAI